MHPPLQVLLICVLALIPLPGPGLFKLTCCRDNSRIVRKIVQSKVLPVLAKFNVQLGHECPFHPARDVFAPEQMLKHQDRPSQFTCGVCGKSFFEEKFLDLHFGQRHNDRVNTAEDAVCLASYCDIMRCDVLVALDSTLIGGGKKFSTDIEVWHEAAARTAVAITTTSTTSATLSSRSSSSSVNSRTRAQKLASEMSRGKCDRSSVRNKSKQVESDEDEDDDDEEEEEVVNSQSCDQGERQRHNKDTPEEVNGTEDVVSTPLDRKQQRIVEMQRMKANCKKEELDALRAKCQMIIRDCIGGLLINLSQQEFKEMEGEKSEIFSEKTKANGNKIPSR